MTKVTTYLLTLFITLFFTACFNEKDNNTKFYGNVDLRTVSLGLRVPGKISKIYFDEGQKVKKDDLLASVDKDLFQQSLDEIKAQVDMQKIQVEKLEKGYRKEEIAKAKALLAKSSAVLNKAQIDLKRYNKLLKTNSISKEKHDDILLSYNSAKAQYDYDKNNYEQLQNGYQKEDIESAHAKLKYLQEQEKEAQIHLHDTQLFAPNDGTILTRAYEVGAIVPQSSPIIEMALQNQYWVRSYISEKYLGIIKPNMQAKVYTDSRPNKPYKAIVSFISPQAEFTPKSVQTQELRTQLVYRVRLILQEHDDLIQQGMPVTIEFDNLSKDK
ncbi:secretion protein HlyD family protein [Arcobacter nitrofigilis DSM 7299]|uniref:Secretion protein HlyD family protein n=1 Tax=Arcobacter nitrofigilis (strain ATCC 33309 / DSM 7299 / CCUG 15893 / LMG 7604 / NCTC 12251 / CI) TaxID=572480 RepID=D5V4I3_ARCNC|nr:efflux RND transporter periplasmic adaptor subunit [Arcobacter nitrofigilis]ADG92888.1 secretion protein HlyD family protein [Arcobacter nitrofigilis DSM 7299]